METEAIRTKSYAGVAPSARHVIADDTPSPRRSRAKRLATVNRSTRLGKRISELTATFAAAVGGEITPMRRLLIDRAAQLTAIAEKARGDFMRDGVGTLDDLVRCERKADQAVRALGELEQKPRPPTLAELMASPR